MTRLLLLDAHSAEERRAALLEDGRLSLLWVERDDRRTLVGNIYKGRVARVETSIGAAFVDLGLDRPGFLPGDDLVPLDDGDETQDDAAGADSASSTSTRLPRPVAEIPPIETLLSAGDTVIVQVVRDPLGRKGPTITTRISYPGRTIVLLPASSRRAVSRKIERPETRARILALLDRLALPPGTGLVARTAIEDAAEDDVLAEVLALSAARAATETLAAASAAPCLLREDEDFVVRAVREMAGRAPDGSAGPLEVVCEGPGAADRARAALGSAAAQCTVREHAGPLPLFHAHGAEKQVRELRSRRVPLAGGASLSIDETEAMWTIDVNSAKFHPAGTIEETALETDLLAAREIARQIRLRDLSGLIAVDFIDCKDEVRRRSVEETFRAELARDPAKMRVAPLSEFMTVEITRRRTRTSVARGGTEECPCCAGRGRVMTAAAAATAVMREVRAIAAGASPAGIEIRCAEGVGAELDRRSAALQTVRDRGIRVDIVRISKGQADAFDVSARR